MGLVERMEETNKTEASGSQGRMSKIFQKFKSQKIETEIESELETNFLVFCNLPPKPKSKNPARRFQETTQTKGIILT